MVIYENPWPYAVIDNFYPNDVFETIQLEARRFLAKNVTVETCKQEYQNPDNDILKHCINSKLLDTSYLEKFPNHREYKNIKPYWELNYLRGPLSYPIHDEAPRKVLSSVVYVAPEENLGTRLYDKDKNLVTEIEWKPNRAFIFAGIDGLTWHDYHCPKGKLRITINQFLERYE